MTSAMMPTADTGLLKNKVALVTGGASGIGRATALLFAREGASVVVIDVKASAGREVEGQISSTGGQALFLEADVSLDRDCQRVVQQVRQQFGAIQVVFNNVGIIRRASVLELSQEDWDRVMTVNVKSVYLVSRHVIPLMVESGGGSIINTASGWGLAGGAKAAVYCASEGSGGSPDKSDGDRSRSPEHSRQLHLSRRY
jgi:NAD(P)-dependent dehydrogenase (short-subunit alcohol dehydrogenase family)